MTRARLEKKTVQRGTIAAKKVPKRDIIQQTTPFDDLPDYSDLHIFSMTTHEELIYINREGREQARSSNFRLKGGEDNRH